MRQLIQRLLFLMLLAVPLGASAQQSATPPEAYTLTAAYPNPFNPTTSFSLTVKERQEVTVTVYNMLGQPVRELFSGVLEAGDRQTFTFTAENLPSGIYLYRVAGETFTATRQVTLLK